MFVFFCFFVCLNVYVLHLFAFLQTFSALKLFEKGERRGSSWRISLDLSSSLKRWNWIGYNYVDFDDYDNDGDYEIILVQTVELDRSQLC